MFGRLGACQHCGNPVGAFDPEVSSIENLRTGSKAVENLAEEPFTGVSAATFGEVLRPYLPRRLGDFLRRGNAGVIFPKPGHCGGIFGEPSAERQRLAIGIYRQRRAAGSVDTNPDDLPGVEAFYGPFGERQRFLDRPFGTGDVIGGMLACQIGVPREDHTFDAISIIPNRGRYFAAIGGIHHDGAYGIGTVIQPNRVAAAVHRGYEI